MRLIALILILVLASAALAVDYTNKTSMTFTANISDAESGVAKVRWLVDGTPGAWISMAPAPTWTGTLTLTLHNGRNEVGMEAVDAAGNVGIIPSKVVSVDASPPGGSISGG